MPLLQNLNNLPLFSHKSPLFGAFWGKNKKNSNSSLPHENPHIFISSRRLIEADTVLTLKTYVLTSDC